MFRTIAPEEIIRFAQFLRLLIENLMLYRSSQIQVYSFRKSGQNQKKIKKCIIYKISSISFTFKLKSV